MAAGAAPPPQSNQNVRPQNPSPQFSNYNPSSQQAPGYGSTSPAYGSGMAAAKAPQEIMRLTVKMRAGAGMAIDWGFRTAGGDGLPLRITTVRPESMAEDVGLQVSRNFLGLVT